MGQDGIFGAYYAIASLGENLGDMDEFFCDVVMGPEIIQHVFLLMGKAEW